MIKVQKQFNRGKIAFSTYGSRAIGHPKAKIKNKQTKNDNKKSSTKISYLCKK